MNHLFPRSTGSSTYLWCTIGRNMSEENMEQQINIKSCVKNGKSTSESLALLAMAYDEYTMKKPGVFLM
jgi:hypothetical protein